MPIQQESHSGAVSVEEDGHTFSALYRVDGHVMTVSTEHATRTIALRNEPIQLQAQEVLRDMVREHQVQPDSGAHHPKY